jgi:hypothetical protein
LIAELKAKAAKQNESQPADQKSADAGAASTNNQEVIDRLDRLEHQLTDMNERLRRIESSLPGSKSD